MRTGQLTADPTIGVQAKGGDGRLPRVLDRRDLDALLDGRLPEDEPDWRRRRDDAVLEVLYGSGLRVSELCGLDTTSIDLDQGAVVVWGQGREAATGPAVGAGGRGAAGVGCAMRRRRRSTPTHRRRCSATSGGDA